MDVFSAHPTWNMTEFAILEHNKLLQDFMNI